MRLVEVCCLDAKFVVEVGDFEINNRHDLEVAVMDAMEENGYEPHEIVSFEVQAPGWCPE